MFRKACIAELDEPLLIIVDSSKRIRLTRFAKAVDISVKIMAEERSAADANSATLLTYRWAKEVSPPLRPDPNWVKPQIFGAIGSILDRICEVCNFPSMDPNIISL